MHYTAMAAAYFMPGNRPSLRHTVEVSTLGAFAIGTTTLLLLGTVLVTSWIDRRLANERVLQHVLEAVNVWIWRMDPRSRRRQFVNPGGNHIFGFPLHEIEALDCWLTHVHPDDRDHVARQYSSATDSPTPIAFEYRFISADGSLRWIRGLVRGVEARGRKHLLGTMLDVTDRRAVEQALIAKDKIAVLGRLAATIAHEINNPLAAALNCIFLVRSSSFTSPEDNARLQVAELELRRAADIAKRTLAFHRDPTQPGVVDLHLLLNDLVALYTPRLRNKEIAVVRQFASRGSAYGRAGDLRQVFSNLLANAIDALQDGGHVVIRTSDWRKAAQGSPEGLLVTIADDGCGIGVETKTRIFEPLFTTKDGVGTGLGLWVVSELVSKHGGWIKVRSKVQEGSVFSVFLPVHALGSVSSATVS